MKASIHPLPAPLLPARPLITDHWPLVSLSLLLVTLDFAFWKGVLLVALVLVASFLYRFLGAPA